MIRVRSRCSYHNRYHHYFFMLFSLPFCQSDKSSFKMLLPQQVSPPRFHCLFFQILVSFLAFFCEYPAISGCCTLIMTIILHHQLPSVSSLFFFYVWSFDPRLISKPNYYMLAGVFPWGCIILNIPGSL